jgi:hypothetical protein
VIAQGLGNGTDRRHAGPGAPSPDGPSPSVPSPSAPSPSAPSPSAPSPSAPSLGAPSLGGLGGLNLGSQGAERPSQGSAGLDGSRSGGSRSTAAPSTGDAERQARTRDLLGEVGVAPLPELPWMNWAGEISTALAQRIACDCQVWRAILDPATGLPLEVGRAHRIVPHWIRKALHARDRGCRWPGCTAPTAWTDAHHLVEWYYGETNIDNMLLLCRWHDVKVHEGQWRIRLNRSAGEVTVTRPNGTPYELGPSQPYLSANRRRGEPALSPAA